VIRAGYRFERCSPARRPKNEKASTTGAPSLTGRNKKSLWSGSCSNSVGRDRRKKGQGIWRERPQALDTNLGGPVTRRMVTEKKSDKERGQRHRRATSDPADFKEVTVLQKKNAFQICHQNRRGKKDASEWKGVKVASFGGRETGGPAESTLGGRVDFASDSRGKPMGGERSVARNLWLKKGSRMTGS